jgi:putative flippase GtrA
LSFIIALSIGYLTKFFLDRKFVFIAENENKKI